MSSAPQIGWEDYARAESFLPWNVAKRAFKLSVTPHWIDGGDRFWYLNRTRNGSEFVLVDPRRALREPAFDHARLAATLSVADGTYYEPGKLPFESIEFVQEGRAIRFETASARWTCDLTEYTLTRQDKRPAQAEAELLSPDGTTAAFVRDSNLWLRDIASGAERQLTTDGEVNNAWATQPEAHLTTVTDRLTGRKIPPCALWSPDSSKLVTHRIDERQVLNMYLLQALRADGNPRPALHAYRYPLPGDEHIAMAEFWVFDAATGAGTRIDMPPTMAPTFSPFDRNDVAWTKGSSRVVIVTHERGYHATALVVADAATGAVVTAVAERGPTFVAPSLSPVADKPMVYSTDDGAEALWMSERDGWAHLYLYDQASGTPVRQVTSGPWAVRELCHVDDAGRTVFFTAGGREANRDPYLRHLYRVDLDDGDPHLLTPEDADHQVTFSPSGAYFVDTYSRIDLAPVSVLRDANGTLVLALEEADLGLLFDAGWRFPEPFRVKARDGVTDIYGILIRPTTFDPTKRYPVLDGIYPGPQVIRTPKRIEEPLPRTGLWHDQALAELGFVIINIDGFGTPYRSKAFHDFSYGNLQDGGGLPEHIGGLRQLAATHHYLDLERVGIYGHSGGGYASVRAMLAYPEFYKVAVSSAGNHDQRGYLAYWGELYIGLLEGDNYDPQINRNLAANLAGKLLLAWGEMDDNVHNALTIQLIDALIKANKDVDMLIIPNGNHAFADVGLGKEDPGGTTTNNLYFIRRKWDYFVQHLAGATPPRGYRIRQPGEV
ncbi:MAG: peptidase S9 [Chloroflexi bacterium]|nr:MAG: peptidase S9 [Chloroflexota bacterium]